MTATLTLTLVDGVHIVVPNSLELITPYVLLEQQDWFEDEIKFLRKLLQSGQKVIDIGANYGTYSLSMAKTVGETGKVWAFEPASSTAKFLAESIELNGFKHIVLEQSALSSQQGTARLSLNANSELNALVHENSTTASETVPLVTLDDCLEKYDWQDIDFMKIDAEGEEANILKGGKRFFSELSPLIQYEIKADDKVHLELIQYFAELGYISYRLVPALNLLVPFDSDKPIVDDYVLNLFCCKQDRAEQLVASGFLLLSKQLSTNDFQTLSKLKSDKKYNWYSSIASLPYGKELRPLWDQLPVSENTAKVYEALSFYAISQDISINSTIRFNALETSFNLFNNLCQIDPCNLRLASFARVAFDYGARTHTVNALQTLINTIYQHNQIILHEPFLVPNARFDLMSLGQLIGNWVLAAALETFEKTRFFSSFFYSGQANQQVLETINDLGFASEEMQRRLNLFKKRFNLSAS